MVCECKFTETPVGVSVIDEVEEKIKKGKKVRTHFWDFMHQHCLRNIGLKTVLLGFHMDPKTPHRCIILSIK